MKGNTPTTIFIIILIAIGAWMFLGRNPVDLDGTSGTASTTVTQNTPGSTGSTAKINEKTVSLLVADTPDGRELGLGGRASLAENEAMIFVFDVPGKYEFWMKDMKFPLDMIWLDPNYKVIYIEPNIGPDTYPDQTFMPEDDALYVLEANAGFAEKNNVKVGDTIEVNLKK